jgi:ketosteroid isomerase-like protein
MLADLQHLNETWTRAWLEKDAATVERLMAEDYLYVGPKGPVLDRPAILGIIRSPSYRLTRSTRTEAVVRPLSNDAAIIRQRSQSAGTFEGVAFEEDHRCLMVCVRQGADWRIVMEQHSQNGGKKRCLTSPRLPLPTPGQQPP